ncbi:MAG: alpha-hydroxy-acid oxidizing protein [archaeon]|nr:alpha-hydroxy-acid oxidizing protein [archaeon]
MEKVIYAKIEETIEAKDLNTRQLNKALKDLSERAKKIIIKDPKGKHHIVAGLCQKVEIDIEGSVGYFVGTMIDGSKIRIHGNAGWFAGDNITSGEVIIDGHAGNGPGQGIYGGVVAIKGDAGDRVGALMKRGTVIIGGSTGIMTGLYMMGGEIIVLGNLGDYAGESIIGGHIIFTGNAPSLGKNAKIVELNQSEDKTVRILLEKYGFNAPSHLRKIVPEKPRPFYKEVEKPKVRIRRTHTHYQVSINQILCNKCKVCIRFCPKEVFELVRESVIPVQRIECVGCRVCMEYCPTHAIEVIPIPLDSKFIWNNYSVDEIQRKADFGHHLVRGMGAWRKFLHFDDLVLLCAQASRPPIDHYREPCNTETVIGTRFAEKPLILKAPILIGAMSFGAISKEAKIAIAKAASNIGIAVNTGEGGMLPEERENSSILISQYASGRFGVSAHYLQVSDAVEIKIGQGAKSGQGGLLLGEKVSEEIASVRGIPIGTDAISPARHLDIVGPEDLKMKIEQLREVTDWKVPIMVKYSAGRVFDDVKIAAKAGADIVVVDGKQAGTGAAPEIVLEQAGMPTLPALVEANKALKEIGLRDEVNLVISGGIRNGADIAKAIALGADAVAMSTSILIAMGCTVCGLCNTGLCPRGIATQDPSLRKRLKVDIAAVRVENYLRATIEELEMLAQLAGKTDVRNFELEDLRAITVDASAITGVKLAGRD